MDLLIATIVSGIVELVKRYFGTTPGYTLLILAGASYFGASLMYALQSAGLWETFARIAIQAAGIFALLVKHLPKTEQPS